MGRAFNKDTARALMLNASYEPLKVVNWKKAFVLWFQGKVDILEHHKAVARSCSKAYQIPSVIRLRSYVKLSFDQKIRFCRENIYRRDAFECQYCGDDFSARDLTLDHVVPASRGGLKNWNNIVTACKSCNQRKGNRLPEEANMPLIKRPYEPAWMPGKGLEVEISFESVPESWQGYLFFASPQTKMI